jgi:Fic family protein
MSSLLELDAMQERIRFVAERWIARTRGAKTIPDLLRDVFLRGEISRGDAERILQKPERTARRILGRLVEEGLLTSAAPGAPVRFGFPAALVGYYFPRLYPEGIEMESDRSAGAFRY